MNTLNKIYWAIYRLFPRGKRAWILRKGYEGLRTRASEKRGTKLKVVHSANKLIKEKKLLGFGSKGSISKSKKSDHEIIQHVRHDHKEELAERGINITKQGKIKNA